MVLTLEEFQKNPDEALNEALDSGEAVIIKTGLGNFVLLSQDDYLEDRSSIPFGPDFSL